MMPGNVGITGSGYRPSRDWRFWAQFAAVFPIALASVGLLWLYTASFAISPSGAVAYVAAAIQILLSIKAVIFTWRSVMEAKARRKQGLPPDPQYFKHLPGMAALLLITAPIVPICVHSILPNMPPAKWIEMANWTASRALGF